MVVLGKDIREDIAVLGGESRTLLSVRVIRSGECWEGEDSAGISEPPTINRVVTQP